MSSVIKFRVRDEETKKFYYTDTNWCHELRKSYTQENWEKLPKQLFTMLLDKNGKEIYEGDIIDGHFTPIPSPNYIGNAPAGYNVRVFIEWNNTGFLAKNLRKGKASKAWERKPLQHIKEMVVIGNIYENPDLIK